MNTDGGLIGTSTLYVRVDPVNEHDPVFSSFGAYSFPLSEDAPPGTVLGTVQATDADSGGADGTVTFMLDSGENLELVDRKDFSLAPRVA